MARKKLTSEEQWAGTKKYRVRWGDLTEPDKTIVKETGPYDDRWSTHIESDGMYESLYTDKKEAYELADRLKSREDPDGVRVEEYYRRQRPNRGKRYKTGKGFNIRDLVF